MLLYERMNWFFNRKSSAIIDTSGREDVLETSAKFSQRLFLAEAMVPIGQPLAGGEIVPSFPARQ